MGRGKRKTYRRLGSGLGTVSEMEMEGGRVVDSGDEGEVHGGGSGGGDILVGLFLKGANRREGRKGWWGSGVGVREGGGVGVRGNQASGGWRIGVRVLFYGW